MAVEEVLRYAKEAHRKTPSEWPLVILIDVKNAFNTAPWDKIISSLERLEIPTYLTNVVKDYLTQRAIYKDKSEKIMTNVGVPQGSVLGPTLWNIMYDGVLRTGVPDGVKLVGYADDLAIVVTDKDIQRLVIKANQAIEAVGNWMRSNGLLMAPEKTEAVLLRFGRRRQQIAVTVEGVQIEVKDTVKYLGVTLDSTVTFGPHIRAVAAKAERTVGALSRLMPNIGGPGEERRRVLCSVAHSIILYAAPVWAEVMRVASYRQTLQAVQRKAALRVCRAYRTVSFAAATVLASVMPIHLMAMERNRIFRLGRVDNASRKEEHERMLEIWQQEWAEGEKGAWTRTLIRDIRPWVTRKHGNLDFHLTQVMTGHGAFKAYTYRIGKSQDDQCQQCRETDTAEHALFHCSKFREEREAVNNSLSTVLSTANMVEQMLMSADRWEVIRRYASCVMTTKEQEERTGRP